MQRSCDQCGAPLEVPAAATLTTFACKFCGREHSRREHLSREDALAEDLGKSVGQKLEGYARGQRRLVLGLAMALVALVAITLGFTVLGRSSPAIVVASAPPPPPAVPPVPPAPVPPIPSVAAAPSATEAPQLVAFELSFGGEGSGPGKFDRVHNLAADREGNVFVVDRTNRVQKFDANGSLLATFQVETKNEPRGELSSDIRYAIGVARDSKQRLYVSIGYDILVLDARDGHRLAKLGGTPDQICYRELAVDQADNLYAVSECSDTHQHALLKLAPSGRVLLRIQEPKSYELATSEKLAIDAGGKIYAPHGYESEVQVLAPDGKLFTRIGRAGNKPGEFAVGSAVGPCVIDEQGRLFVRDASEVEIFDAAGRSLGSFTPKEGAIDLTIGGNNKLYALSGKGIVQRYGL